MLATDVLHCPMDGGIGELVYVLAKDTLLGGYRIERLIGEGGMGFVYEATHEVLNRRSAIKMLRPELASHKQITTRFLNEAKAVNLIDHQHIVNVYDYGEAPDGSVYFVMEYLDGQTLDDLMHKRPVMPVPVILHVFGQVAKALAAAHAKQIVHRDLKPANVFIVAREENPYFVKLLDFGVAQLRGDGAQALTLAGSVMGTPQYMSPEQISGGEVDARSDVWAMGVMMYRAATGQAPFRGEELGELADKILHHPPPRAHELADVPEALSGLIATCLERRIEARCPSISALLDGLDQVKRACKLDDDAIAAAIWADVGVLSVQLPMPRPEPTRESLAGSLPRYQGAPDGAEPILSAPPRPRSRVGLYASIVAVAGVIGGVAYGMHRRGEANAPVAESHLVAQAPVEAASRSIAQLWADGDAAAARELAERDLRAAIASGTLQQKGFAVDALGRVHTAAGAPLLYAALGEAPAVRIKAAHALGELALPDAAPRLRAALATSGEALKVELAAVLFRLGDKDARAILMRAIDEPTTRLAAAAALAEAGDGAGRSALGEVLEALPPGREAWRRAAGGLIALGDGHARSLLEAELSQSDPSRAVGAAAVLARAGDGKARELLARLAGDPAFARRGDAAVALAELGDPRALAWVGDGFASPDREDRMAALATCGALAASTTGGAGAADRAAAIAKLATSDPDPSVRLTAEAVLFGQR